MYLLSICLCYLCVAGGTSTPNVLYVSLLLTWTYACLIILYYMTNVLLCRSLMVSFKCFGGKVPGPKVAVFFDH